MSENFKFVQNLQCEYFPCHRVDNKEEFNCLFCFCPLYMLKQECGGNFKYTNDVKDCSDCTIPHTKNAYAYVMDTNERWRRILACHGRPKSIDHW